MGNPNLPSTKTGFLPWEAMNTGKPDRPNYITNPNQVQGFDSSKLRQQMGERMGMEGKQAQGQYLAGQSKLMGGVGRSSGAGTGLANIATETERGKNSMDADLEWRDYQSRKQLMDALNGIKSNEYNGAMGEYQAEQGQRQSALGGMLGVGAQLAGMELGGGMGAEAAPSYTQQLIQAGADPMDMAELNKLYSRLGKR